MGPCGGADIAETVTNAERAFALVAAPYRYGLQFLPGGVAAVAGRLDFDQVTIAGIGNCPPGQIDLTGPFRRGGYGGATLRPLRPPPPPARDKPADASHTP